MFGFLAIASNRSYSQERASAPAIASGPDADQGETRDDVRRRAAGRRVPLHVRVRDRGSPGQDGRPDLRRRPRRDAGARIRSDASRARRSSPPASRSSPARSRPPRDVDIPRIVRERIAAHRLHAGEVRLRRRRPAASSSRSTSSRPTSRRASTSRSRRSTSRRGRSRSTSVGAGDQGMMFGYACRETDELMPLPIALAHRSASGSPRCARTARSHYLRPDGKTQVTVRYDSRRARPPHAGRDRARPHLDAAPRRRSTRSPDQAGPHRARDRARFSRDRAPVRRGSPRARDFVYVNPTGQLRRRRADGRHRPDRAQDHRRHLRRRCASRRRRLLGEGPDEGRPLGRLRRALRGQERRRRRSRAIAARCRSPTPSASHSRSRSTSSASAPRSIPGRAHRGADPSSTSTSGRPPSCAISTCAGRSTRRPRRTGTSAARPRLHLGAHRRADALRAAAGLAREPRRGVARGMTVTVVGSVAFDSLETPFGRRERILGGAATHFSLAASIFTDVRVVGVVGRRLRRRRVRRFHARDRHDDVERVAGERSFFWAGSLRRRHAGRADDRHAAQRVRRLRPEALGRGARRLDGVPREHPARPPARRARAVRRGASSPGLDSMNYWIESARESLLETIAGVDVVMLNDAEVRMLTGEPNLTRAARADLRARAARARRQAGQLRRVHVHRRGLLLRPGLSARDRRRSHGRGRRVRRWLLRLPRLPRRVGELTDEVLRRAAVYGSVMASFAIEDFGSERLRARDPARDRGPLRASSGR